MIEKLEKHIIGENAPGMVSLMVAPTAEQRVDKINELVDAVNKLETMAKNTNTVLESLVVENNIHEKQIDELQMKLEPQKCEPPADPYAEQRRWIGKLCRFRDNPACEWKYGILEKIYEDAEFPFWDTDCYEYAECEPVKPDDPIIYKTKGGDNE